MEVKLNHLQRVAFDAVVHEKKSCFITGGAGTGKSYLIHCIKKRFKEEKIKFHVLAPTGVAAANVEGQTYHTMFGIYPGDKYYTKFCNIPEAIKENLRKVQVLIFDEISMVSGETC